MEVLYRLRIYRPDVFDKLEGPSLIRCIYLLMFGSYFSANSVH